MNIGDTKPNVFFKKVKSYLNFSKFISSLSNPFETKELNDELNSLTSSESDITKEVCSDIDDSVEETNIMPAVYSILKKPIEYDKMPLNRRNLIKKDPELQNFNVSEDEDENLFIRTTTKNDKIGGSEGNVGQIGRSTLFYKSLKKRAKSSLESFFLNVD